MKQITHYASCNPDYPEKPEEEAPQATYDTKFEDGNIIRLCVDCGAYVILTSEEAALT